MIKCRCMDTLICSRSLSKAESESRHPSLPSLESVQRHTVLSCCFRAICASFTIVQVRSDTFAILSILDVNPKPSPLNPNVGLMKKTMTYAAGSGLLLPTIESLRMSKTWRRQSMMSCHIGGPNKQKGSIESGLTFQ